MVLSRLGAWASEQSAPVASRAELLARVEQAAKRFGVPTDGSRDAEIPRPAHWGGYDVWADRVELWIGQPGRIHDRGDWTRTLVANANGFTAGAWSATRLQP
jgi:pyridoxamine 5'-phosphate oxidase